MGKVNTWYVIAKKDSNNPYGYSQITPKGIYFKSERTAQHILDRLQVDTNDELFILKRTCEVMPKLPEPTIAGFLSEKEKAKIAKFRLKQGWLCRIQPSVYSGLRNIWSKP